MSLTVQITDHATPALQRLAIGLNRGQELNRAMADGAAVLVRDHFAGAAGSNRNPYGAPSTFWRRMRGGVRARADATAGVVAMPREIAQRYFGGPLSPTGGRRYLTIPARREAYGKRAREFRDLVFVPRKGGKAMLVQAEQTKFLRSGKKLHTTSAGGGVFFWLVPGVTQHKNPDVLPTEQQIRAAAVGSASRYFTRIIERTPNRT